jgi:hypothetical protein
LHYHLTNAQLFIGGFALILTLLLAVSAFLDFRPRKTPPFRNYFYAESDGEHLEHGSLSEPAEWGMGEHSRMIDFEFSDSDAAERLTRIRNAAHQNREFD